MGPQCWVLKRRVHKEWRGTGGQENRGSGEQGVRRTGGGREQVAGEQGTGSGRREQHNEGWESEGNGAQKKERERERERERKREREKEREREKNEVYHTNCYWVKWRVHLFFQNFN